MLLNEWLWESVCVCVCPDVEYLITWIDTLFPITKSATKDIAGPSKDKDIRQSSKTKTKPKLTLNFPKLRGMLWNYRMIFENDMGRVPLE